MSIIYKGHVILSTPDSSKFYTPHQVSSKLWINAKYQEKLCDTYDSNTINNIINCTYNSQQCKCDYDVLHELTSLQN